MSQYPNAPENYGVDPVDDSNKSPEELRAEIEATRRNLGYDVDAMAEKVTPAKVAERQKNKIQDKVQDKLGSVKDSIMGSADDASARGNELADQARDAAGQARQTVGEVPGQIKSRTRGNPLAAGLIALGAGWLIGSLIPATEKEQQAAGQIKDAAQPLVSEAQSVAKEMGEGLKEPAMEAAESVKQQATSGAESVKSDATSEADRLKSEAQSSGENINDSRH